MMRSHLAPEFDTATLDRARFDDLVRANYPVIFRFSFRLTGCRCAAEDLTQDTFVRAYRAFDTYDRSRPFKAWIQRITYRLFLDRLRGQKVPEPLSLDEFSEAQPGEVGFAREIPDDRYDPERLVLAEVMDERLEKALNRLPAEFRVVIVLCDLQGMSYEEIAARLGCTKGTVRSRIHRARKTLQRLFGVERDAKRRARPAAEAASALTMA